MIFLSRTIAVVLGLPLLGFLLMAIVTCQVSATVVNADFYKSRLSNAHLYTFALTELPPAIAADVRRSGNESSKPEGAALIISGLSDQDIVDSLNRVLPEAWLRATIEQALDEIVPYAAGGVDEFSLLLEPDESSETLIEEVKRLLRKSNFYVTLSERVAETVAEDVMRATGDPGAAVGADRIAQAVVSVFAADWLQVRIEGSLDEIDQYILGESDSFDLRLEIRESVRHGAEEVTDILREEDAYDILVEDAIVGSIFEELGGQTAVDIIERLRGAFSGDLAWTERDLHSLVESEFGNEGLQGFQQTRTWLSRLRLLGLLAWAFVIALLISIGLLGGRDWCGRITWAADCLAVVALLLFVAFRFLRSAWNSLLDDARSEALGEIDTDSSFAATEGLITGKSFEIVADASSVFIDGMERQSLICFLIGLALVAGVVGWRRWRARARKTG